MEISKLSKSTFAATCYMDSMLVRKRTGNRFIYYTPRSLFIVSLYIFTLHDPFQLNFEKQRKSAKNIAIVWQPWRAFRRHQITIYKRSINWKVSHLHPRCYPWCYCYHLNIISCCTLLSEKDIMDIFAPIIIIFTLGTSRFLPSRSVNCAKMPTKFFLGKEICARIVKCIRIRWAINISSCL